MNKLLIESNILRSTINFILHGIKILTFSFPLNNNFLLFSQTIVQLPTICLSTGMIIPLLDLGLFHKKVSVSPRIIATFFAVHIHRRGRGNFSPRKLFFFSSWKLFQRITVKTKRSSFRPNTTI